MISRVLSVAYQGLHCQLIEVEADVSQHMPAFVLVGLPDAAVQEAKERIRSALDNSDLSFPRTKVTVNLAPANIRKEGSFYDLAIAISVIIAQDIIELDQGDRQAIFIGELSLSGLVRPVSGVLLAVDYLKQRGYKKVYVGTDNAKEASYVSGLSIYPVHSLKELVEHLLKVKEIKPLLTAKLPTSRLTHSQHDFADVQGQYQAKRALEIAAAGGHNLILNGVPGSGKTMLAKSFMSILPELTSEEVLEVSKIYSCSGMLDSNTSLMNERPYRSPHHTASVASIVGGGTWPKPGEITLAHRGVLFLDEFPEFPRSVLESLRQPLEDKIVSISRVSGSLQFPAHFILFAAQNPCPCGYWGDTEKRCSCSEYQRRMYSRKVSGPLLDRIDLHVKVFAVKRERLLNVRQSESSAEVLKRVKLARARQRSRFNSMVFLNCDMNHRLLKNHSPLDNETKKILLTASRKLHLSARSFYKTIKVSRTIADLADSNNINKGHLLESLQYRPVE